MPKHRSTKTDDKHKKNGADHSTLLYRIFLLILPSAVAGITALVLLSIRVPTHVRVDLTVYRFAFRLAQSAPGDELFRSFDTRSVSLDNFSTAQMASEQLYRADPHRLNSALATFPSIWWHKMPLERSLVTIRGKGPGTLPFIRLEPSDTQDDFLTLDPIRIKPGSSVILDISEVANSPSRPRTGPRSPLTDGTAQRKVELNAQLELVDSSLSVYTHSPVTIYTRDCIVEDSSRVLDQAGVAIYRAHLPVGDYSLKINERAGVSHLFFTPEPTAMSDLLLAHSLEITGPTFIREIANVAPAQGPNPSAQYVSAINPNAQNTISYLDYPTLPQVTLDGSAVLYLSPTAIFSLDAIDVPTSNAGLHVTLEGRTDLIYSKMDQLSVQRDRTKNYQLDLFTVLRANRFWAIFAVIVWFMTTTLATRKIVNELRNEANK